MFVGEVVKHFLLEVGVKAEGRKMSESNCNLSDSNWKMLDSNWKMLDSNWKLSDTV